MVAIERPQSFWSWWKVEVMRHQDHNLRHQLVVLGVHVHQRNGGKRLWKQGVWLVGMLVSVGQPR